MNQPANNDAKIKIGIPLYPKFDSLDVMGPYQVFTYAPNLELHLVAATLNIVTSLEGVRVMPELSFDQCPKLDVLLVPVASDLVSPLLCWRGAHDGRRQPVHWFGGRDRSFQPEYVPAGSGCGQPGDLRWQIVCRHRGCGAGGGGRLEGEPAWSRTPCSSPLRR